MTTLQEMDERMRSIQTDLRGLAEITNPSDEDVILQDSLIAEYSKLESDAEPLRTRMAELDRIRKAAASDDSREEVTSSRNVGGVTITRSNREPLDLNAVHDNLVRPDELRHRAVDLIERNHKEQRWEFSDSAAEAATVRAQYSPQISRHILLTGSEEYREAFRSYMMSGDETSFRDIRLAVASGGYMLPYVLDPTIVLTNAGSSNPFRRVGRVVQTTSNTWNGVSSAGVNAAFIAEAATAADGAPSDFAQIQITPVKGAAWVLGTYEALDDTDFGAQLPRLLGDAKDRLESSKFATGSGTAVPLGVIAALGTGSRVAPTTTGTAFNGTGALPDVGNLKAALPARFRQNGATFMGNIVQLNKVRAMDQYGGGGFWANFMSDTPASLYGDPVYEASDLSAVTTGTSAASGTGSATLLYGDFNEFIIADRVGVSMLYDPLVKGTGGGANLPAGQAGWYMFWRTSSAVSTTAAFRYLTIS
jgi:HK97 family phage major capsid protein